MGRRSVNTTKSGKYMNPTDQARKIARKKELKKNKKQRNAVRLAVLKNKDPFLILDEMTKIDKMEYDPTQPPPLNERVLKEKRRKLKETYERVINMYEREDADYVMELRKAEVEYEKQREQRILYYEQVKNVEKVKLDRIPLPDAPSFQAVASDIPLPGDIPLPPPSKPVHSILKKTHHIIKGKLLSDTVTRKTVGPPPGSPPPLVDIDDDVVNARRKHIRFENDKEEKDTYEEKDSRAKYKLLAQQINHTTHFQVGDDQDRLSDDGNSLSDEEENYAASHIRLPTGPPPSLPSGPPPNFSQMLFRMPRLAPPIPKLPLPPRLVQLPVMETSMNMMNAPPNLQHQQPLIAMPGMLHYNSQQVPAADLQQRPVIQAKPQIKNLIGDATKFVPVALRINRGNKNLKNVEVKNKNEGASLAASAASAAVQAQTKDDAYDSFMKEMHGLI